jgi:hypothetical protein
MILKQGKFYDSAGNVVPLEFGNKEQIYILDRVRTLQTEGEELSTFADGNNLCIGINCVCGVITIFEPEGDHLEDLKKKCECGAVYKLQSQGWPVMVKMIK